MSSLAKWNTGGGGAALTVVSSQLASATQAAGLQFYAPMLQACSRLATAVTAAKAGAPIPDAAMQSQYTAALATLAKAAAYCQAAISARPDGDEGVETHENAAVLAKSMSAFAAGAKELFQATAQIKARSLSR